MAFYSGKGGKITFNSVDLPVIDYEANEENNLAQVTNALTSSDADNALAAADAYICGPVTKTEVTSNVVWDSAALPKSIGLIPGLSAAATMQLGASGKSQTGTLFVRNLRPRVNTREGAIQYALAFLFTGAVTRPA